MPELDVHFVERREADHAARGEREGVRQDGDRAPLADLQVREVAVEQCREVGPGPLREVRGERRRRLGLHAQDRALPSAGLRVEEVRLHSVVVDRLRRRRRGIGGPPLLDPATAPRVPRKDQPDPLFHRYEANKRTGRLIGPRTEVIPNRIRRGRPSHAVGGGG